MAVTSITASTPASAQSAPLPPPAPASPLAPTALAVGAPLESLPAVGAAPASRPVPPPPAAGVGALRGSPAGLAAFAFHLDPPAPSTPPAGANTLGILP